MPSITGGMAIVDARIITPVELATARAGLIVPEIGSISRVGAVGEILGTVKVAIPGPVEAVIDIVSTVDIISTVGTVNVVGSISDGKLTSSIVGGSIAHIGYVGTIGTIMYGAAGGAGIVQNVAYYHEIASLSPSTVSGTYISESFDAILYPGGIGFSVAAIGGPINLYYQYSQDATVFRNVAAFTLQSGDLDDRIYLPTRRYWRLMAVNTSTLSATIDRVISLYPL